jgi:hypothetical protein
VIGFQPRLSQQISRLPELFISLLELRTVEIDHSEICFNQRLSLWVGGFLSFIKSFKVEFNWCLEIPALEGIVRFDDQWVVCDLIHVDLVVFIVTFFITHARLYIGNISLLLWLMEVLLLLAVVVVVVVL